MLFLFLLLGADLAVTMTNRRGRVAVTSPAVLGGRPAEAEQAQSATEQGNQGTAPGMSAAQLTGQGIETMRIHRALLGDAGAQMRHPQCGEPG